MVFDDSLFTPEELQALDAQARADGAADLRTWARNRLLAGITPATQARLHPAVAATLDAVDVALDESDGAPKNPSTAESREGAMTFGLPPTHQPALEGPHARTAHSSLATGPIATTETAFAHPCRHLLKTYHPNFSALDSQGTCNAQGREGSVCSWAPNCARSCGSFQAKVLPVPPPHAPPRAARTFT